MPLQTIDSWTGRKESSINCEILTKTFLQYTSILNRVAIMNSIRVTIVGEKKKRIILANSNDSERIGVVVYSLEELKSKGKWDSLRSPRSP